MTAPVITVAHVIEQIGRVEPSELRQQLPHTTDRELGRISEPSSN